MVENQPLPLLRTFFEVLQGLFSVTLLAVTMETLHSQALQTHVAGQVVGPEDGRMDGR